MRSAALLILIVLSSLVKAQLPADKPETRHSIYYEFFGAGLFFGSANYDYSYQFSSLHSMGFRAGLSYYDGPFVIGSINYAIGKKKHFGEIEIGSTTFFMLTGEDGPVPFFRPGYRYSDENGFLLKAAVYIEPVRTGMVLFVPGIGLGYTFK